MPLKQSAIVDLVRGELLPAWRKERERLDRIDKWLRWECEPLTIPNGATREVRKLIELSRTPLLALVVATLTQELKVESYRTSTTATDDAKPWEIWTANRFQARQSPLYHAAIGYGHAYNVILPGEDPITGDEMPSMRGKSPRRMLALYADPVEDDWPMYTVEVERSGSNIMIKVLDEEVEYRLSADRKDPPDTVTFIDFAEHGVGVTPVVRYSPFLDLDGRTDGRVEPFIDVAGRAQKTTFDRLLIQHYNSWKIRTISGMTSPDDESEANRKKLKLRNEDLLIAEDKDTKFGQLDETDVTPILAAYKSDVETLATVSQTPAHTLTGDMVNLSADAIQESRIQLAHLAGQTKESFGQSNKQSLQLASAIRGDLDSARDTTGVCGWADMDSRSLAQAADALVKLKDLGIPLELLWAEIPGWDADKVTSAKNLVKSGGDNIDRLIAELNAHTDAPAGGAPSTGAGGSGANAGG